MAFVGGSKLIIMDEPTSSLDLSARRLLWTMLKKYKKDRIVLLTTHYMDEADILGDRIGVMAEGRISALGTSLFLKKTFSLGFKLNIDKKDAEVNEEMLKFCRLNLGPSCRQLSEISTSMIIQIPTVYQNMFQHFFHNLDLSLDALNIAGYGLSVATLEDVFIEIGHKTDPFEKTEIIET